jgi:ETC complex I subunit conserved region
VAKARIYRPSKTATQSGARNMRDWLLVFEPGSAKGHERLMGWVSSADTRGQVRLKFRSKEEAIAFATRNGLEYELEEPAERVFRPKSYAANFAHNRLKPWTH